jgi:SAM-dependent methyltransferase
MLLMMKVKRSFYTTFSHSFEIENVEEVVCNLCGSGRFKPLGSELDYEIRQCADCGLVYVSPQPAQDEMARFYAGMYEDGSETSVAARSLGAVEEHLWRLLTARRPEGGRLLEIGCGYGRLLKRLDPARWELTAIEMSEAAAAHARNTVPAATVHQIGIEEAAFPAGSQDCIVAVAVLEHLKDPGAALDRMTEWLAPGGLLVLQVPHVAAYIRLKRWLPFLPIHFEAPRHLFDFSPATLPRYLRERGYGRIRLDVARPYASPSALATALIWGVKVPGIVLHALSGGRYVYPFAGAFVVHAIRGREPGAAGD